MDEYKPVIRSDENIPNYLQVKNWMLCERNAESKCFHCGKYVDWDHCDIRMIVPARWGGSKTVSNLKIICHDCCRKEDKDGYGGPEVGDEKVNWSFVVILVLIIILLVLWASIVRN